MIQTGTLYIVATPIGNMGDITFRAVEILKKVRFVACEDTRRTGGLFQKLNLPSKTFISFFEGNEIEKTEYILSLLDVGNDVILVSDGGTPLISDPGFKLVRECRKKDIKVESIPGPTALITALTLSGLPTDRFLFVGFPPKKSAKRLDFFKEITGKNLTVVFYESPHRIVESLKDLKTAFGDIELVVCREMTKIYEETLTNNISEVIKIIKPRGEFTVVFRV